MDLIKLSQYSMNSCRAIGTFSLGVHYMILPSNNAPTLLLTSPCLVQMRKVLIPSPAQQLLVTPQKYLKGVVPS